MRRPARPGRNDRLLTRGSVESARYRAATVRRCEKSPDRQGCLSHHAGKCLRCNVGQTSLSVLFGQVGDFFSASKGAGLTTGCQCCGGGRSLGRARNSCNFATIFRCRAQRVPAGAGQPMRVLPRPLTPNPQPRACGGQHRQFFVDVHAQAPRSRRAWTAPGCGRRRGPSLPSWSASGSRNRMTGKQPRR